ncbi:MAG TPA: OB-fold domain-containing protein [Dehalococcoidia bacterium]|nr:OB-fold domain-containing protein [Dehalococcoidia bacterium]
MAGIEAWGVYIPLYRLSRKEIAQAWGVPAMAGERSVANADEDSLTMAVEAGRECLLDVEPDEVDALFFASATAPYIEHQCAATIAAALDLRREIYTADFGDSLRAATAALRAAADAVSSGSARKALVVAADRRPGEPGSNWEQMLGDGAAAVLLSAEGPIQIKALHSITSDIVGPWRRTEDRFVQSFDAKLETDYGYVQSVAQAAGAVLKKAGLEPKEIAKAAFYAPDPRAYTAAARKLGLEQAQLQDSLFNSVGNAGTPLALIMLAGALEEARPGDRLLLASYGNGSDAFLLEVATEPRRPAGHRSLAAYLASKRFIPTYTIYASQRGMVEREAPPPPQGSAAIYWRDTAFELRFHGARCKGCGLVHYPIPRVCDQCGTRDTLEEVKLPRRGTVFTFTLDHLLRGEYLNTPIPRVVIEIEGGGRAFLEMTDTDPSEVKIGMPVELTFRCLHEAAGFHNYYWKCRPVRAREPVPDGPAYSPSRPASGESR